MEVDLFIKQCSMLDDCLSLSDHLYAVEEFDLSYREVEKIALEMGIVPLRYQRNQSSISADQQKVLFHSHVAIIGCGGLGGHVAEILTRIGIGRLTLYDFDYFEEHNLNRQNFSTIADLGREKVTVVKEALERINPAVAIDALVQRFDPLSDLDSIEEVTLVIDALDDPQTKLNLANACHSREIHCIHGAIAGFHGQFSTNNRLENLYPDPSQGAELSSGNPAFTVTLAASIQASEAIKAILGIGETLHESFMVTDLLYNDFEKFPL